MCVWLLFFCIYAHYYLLPGVNLSWSHYDNLMSSLSRLDSSTHTRDTSDKRQLTYTLARILFNILDCPVLFPQICENELSWCFALSVKFRSLWRNASSVSSYNFRKLHEYSNRFTIMKMFIFRQVDGTFHRSSCNFHRGTKNFHGFNGIFPLSVIPFTGFPQLPSTSGYFRTVPMCFHQLQWASTPTAVAAGGPLIP